jgi:hypothetical protein
MTNERMGIVAILGVIVVVLLYYVSTEAPGGPVSTVPQFDSEAQFFGLNIKGDLSFNPGTVLDMLPSTHFFAPGVNPRDTVLVGQEPVRLPTAYPTVPGGNASSVMHKGWGGFLESAPNNDWFFNPPEAAVLGPCGRACTTLSCGCYGDD